MQTFQGILVVASGNEGDTVTKSEWAGYFDAFGKNEPWANRVMIVAQGMYFNNEEKVFVKENRSSYGEEIDLIVFNGNEFLDRYSMQGSSFATPVVTSVVANYLAMGVPKNEVKELLLKAGEPFTDAHGYTYTDFQMKQAHRLLFDYLDHHHISYDFKDN